MIVYNSVYFLFKKNESPASAAPPTRHPFFPSPALNPFAPPGRLSPGLRPPYGAGDPTPALRQLHEYARPHVLGSGGGAEAPRAPPYTSGGPLQPNPLDPYYRMASMFPQHNSRERLELELDREKRERDAREREMREHSLRDLEMREKLEKSSMPPGTFVTSHNHYDAITVVLMYLFCVF